MPPRDPPAHPSASPGAARLRVRDLAPALARLVPELRRSLPAGPAVFYDIVGEQDLLSSNPLRPRLGPRGGAALRRRLDALPRGPEAALLKAYAALCAGDYPRAARRAGRASGPAGDFLLALALWLRGDAERTRRWLPEALAAVERAVAGGEDGRDALLLRAQIRFEFEDNRGGLRDLARILRRDPGDLAARIGRAEVLADLYRYRPALREISRVLAARPGSWWALAQRARLRGMCGRLAGALADFDAALRKRPRLGSLRAWRAEVLRRLGRRPEALAELDRAVRLDPAYAFGWELRGRLRLASGELREGLRDLERACRLDPAHAMAFLWRGEARLKLRRLAGAWADFERVAPLDPKSAWNAASAGKPAGRAEREAAFWRELDDAAAGRPADPWAWLLRGRFRALAGRSGEALEDLTRALALAGRRRAPRAAALGWRGIVLRRMGAPRLAAAELASALALDPSAGRLRAARAEALAAAGERDQALAEYGRALGRPEQALAPAFVGRARLHAAAGRWTEAAADFRMAAILDSRDPAAAAGLAAAERRLAGARG